MAKAKTQTSRPDKRAAAHAREAEYQAVCDKYKAGKYKSVKEAHRHHPHLSEHTLRRRLKCTHGPAYKAHQTQARLTEAQEDVLEDWIRYLGLMGHPVSYKTICFKVNLLCGNPVSRNWIRRFLKRHPNLHFRKPSGLDPKRAQAFNPVTVHAHFELLDAVCRKLNIKWKNVYSMDEKGIQIGGGRKNNGEKFLFALNDKARYRIKSDNLELVTIIECVAGDGGSIPPGFIFRGTDEYEKEWVYGDSDEDVWIGLSSNGWITENLCYEWFINHFIPQARKRADPGDAILLIFDGHNSHIGLKLVHHAFGTPDINLYCLPRGTTHMLQVLDVGVFCYVDRGWTKVSSDWVANNQESMPRGKVIDLYLEMRKACVTEEIIRAAFKKAGVCPVDKTIFTEKDFAPSYTSSIRSHLPQTYPTSIASAGPSHSTSPSSPLNPSRGSSPDDIESDSEDVECADDDSAYDSNPDDDENPGLASSAENLDQSWDQRIRSIHLNSERDVESVSETPMESSNHLSESPSIQSSCTPHENPAELASASFSTPPRRTINPLIEPIDPRWSTSRKLGAIVNQNRRLIEHAEKVEKERDRAVAHAQLARAENERLVQRLNSRNKKKASGLRFKGQGVWLNRGKGREQYDAFAQRQEAKRQESIAIEERKQLAKRKEKDRQADLVRSYEEGNAAFSGSLKSMSRPEVDDIAHILRLDVTSLTRKEQVADAIRTHLDENPHLINNPAFSALYPGTGSRRTRRARTARNATQDVSMPGPSAMPPAQPNSTDSDSLNPSYRPFPAPHPDENTHYLGPTTPALSNMNLPSQHWHGPVNGTQGYYSGHSGLNHSSDSIYAQPLSQFSPPMHPYTQYLPFSNSDPWIPVSGITFPASASGDITFSNPGPSNHRFALQKP